MKKHFHTRMGATLLALGLAFGGAVGLTAGKSMAAWQPKKPVEFVVMAGKGGGADKMARKFKEIIEWDELSPQPFEPVNKPGGSGAEALDYLRDHAGDPHVIMVTLNSFYTTPLRDPGLDVDIENYTPIARMAEDTFVLWVHSDSPVQSLEDFVAAAKAKGNGWVMAGTGNASEDNLLTDFLNVAFDLKMKYVPFKGGGRVAKELVEKKADSTVNNPSEQDDYFIDGITRPLAAFTPERLDMYHEVPTFREKGEDLVYFMQRSIVGAPGMSAEAAAFYQKLFRKVYESKDWQDYMNANGLRGEFITGDKLKAYWLHEREIHRGLLRKMGQIQ